MPESTIAPPAAQIKAPAAPTTSQTPQGVPGQPPAAPASPGRPPGAARAAVSERLRSVANKDSQGEIVPRGTETPQAPKTGPTPEPPAKPAEVSTKLGSEPVKQGSEPAKPTTPTAKTAGEESEAAAPDPKGGPWQQRNHWRKTAQALETQVAELTKKLATVGDSEANRLRAERAESRLNDLEGEIQLVNFSKSEKFKKEYQQPYEEAWTTAMEELAGIPFPTEDGQVRPFTPQDLLWLANMDPAQEIAWLREHMPDYAQDVKSHIREVRRLARAQNKALEDARKTGKEHEEQLAAATQGIDNENHQYWQQFTESDNQSVEWLKPIEGDNERNDRLEKSRKFVMTAMSANPRDPKLTAEQRQKIIRDKASIHGRAIGFPILRLEIKRLQAELAARDKTIAEFRQGEPTPGQPTGLVASPTTPANRMESIHAKIRAMANKSLGGI